MCLCGSNFSFPLHLSVYLQGKTLLAASALSLNQKASKEFLVSNTYLQYNVCLAIYCTSFGQTALAKHVVHS